MPQEIPNCKMKDQFFLHLGIERGGWVTGVSSFPCCVVVWPSRYGHHNSAASLLSWRKVLPSLMELQLSCRKEQFWPTKMYKNMHGLWKSRFLQIINLLRQNLSTAFRPVQLILRCLMLKTEHPNPFTSIASSPLSSPVVYLLVANINNTQVTVMSCGSKLGELQFRRCWANMYGGIILSNIIQVIWSVAIFLPVENTLSSANAWPVSLCDTECQWVTSHRWYFIDRAGAGGKNYIYRAEV